MNQLHRTLNLQLIVYILINYTLYVLIWQELTLRSKVFNDQYNPVKKRSHFHFKIKDIDSKLADAVMNRNLTCHLA